MWINMYFCHNCITIHPSTYVKENTLRTIVCTAAGLLATALLISMTPREHFIPKGIALPAQQLRAPILPNDVSLRMGQPLETQNYVLMGQVRVEMSYKTANPDVATREALLAKAKSLAASLGANTVVVNVIAPAGIPNTLTLIGTAVYVPRSTQGVKS